MRVHVIFFGWLFSVCSFAALAQTSAPAIPDMPPPEELARSIQKVRALAEKGDANSQYVVGLYLEYVAPKASGASTDKQEARRWYGLAAAQGLAGANYALGKSYGHLNNSDADKAEARRYWLIAAQKGHVGAMDDLSESFRYEYGPSAPRDYEQVVYWKSQAADHKHPQAMEDLAIWYWKGLNGLPMDYQKTRELLFGAADKGVCSAMLNVGGLYLNGDGVEQSASEAERWFAKSKECNGNDAALQKHADKYIKQAQAGDLPRLQAEVQKSPASGASSFNSEVSIDKGTMLRLGIIALIAVAAAGGSTSLPGESGSVPDPTQPLPPCESDAAEFWGHNLFAGPCQ